LKNLLYLLLYKRPYKKLNRNAFYIDYIIGHELGHIIAHDEKCKGNTEGIAEVVGSYISYSFSGSVMQSF